MRSWPRNIAVLALFMLLGGCNSGLLDGNGRFLANFSGEADPVSSGKAHFRSGDFGLAEASFRRAIEDVPTDAEAWLGLAAAQDQLGRFDLADKSYAHLERLVGTTPTFLNNRGYSYLLRGDVQRARRDLDRAAALAPDNPAIKANLTRVASRR